MRNYDVIIVGAGPAGIFTALETKRQNPNKSILLIEEGRQIGYASHEELLANNPVYQEIYASQNVKEVADNGEH